MGIERIAHSALETVINTFRIAPHGFVGVVAAALFADAMYDGALHAQLPQWAQMAQVYVGAVGYTLAGFAPYGLMKHIEYRQLLKRRGFDARHVDVSIKPYCNRQAYKAAAYALGYRKEFDEVNHSKPRWEKMYNWVPEV